MYIDMYRYVLFSMINLFSIYIQQNIYTYIPIYSHDGNSFVLKGLQSGPAEVLVQALPAVLTVAPVVT